MVLNDLGVYLENFLFVTVGTDFFLGHMPSSPDVCTAVIEYGGEAPLRNQSEGAAGTGAVTGERPRVQLIHRATSYETGRSFVQTLWNALDSTTNREINGTFYTRIAALQSPFLLDRDDNDRYIFAFNLQITKHR